MQPPSRADWGKIDKDNPDAQWAFDTFLGKSFAAAEAMFESNALAHQEDLQSMPSVPFNFYVPALITYITSERAKGDSDGASSFLHMISSLLKSNPAIMSSDTKHALVRAAKQIAERQGFYDADISIYGKFNDLYAEIQRLAEGGI